MLHISNFESGFNDLPSKNIFRKKKFPCERLAHFGLQGKIIIIINGNSLAGLSQRAGIPLSYEHNSWLVSLRNKKKTDP